jgi:hypothetical protein
MYEIVVLPVACKHLVDCQPGINKRRALAHIAAMGIVLVDVDAKSLVLPSFFWTYGMTGAVLERRGYPILWSN